MSAWVYRIGGGWLAHCECGWESVNALRARSDAALLKHTTNHPAPKREKTTPKRAAASWDDREDSTWIDKL